MWTPSTCLREALLVSLCFCCLGDFTAQIRLCPGSRQANAIEQVSDWRIILANAAFVTDLCVID